jgi:hypothetical protein
MIQLLWRKREIKMFDSGKYDVIELSEKLVELASELDLSISNLQLQKILYYVQGNYLKTYKRKAFKETIECWEYGPVVKRAWKFFSYYGQEPIKKFGNTIKLRNDEIALFKKILEDCLNLNVWDLVEKTHMEFPWKNAYDNKCKTISDNDMKVQFCK